MKVKFEQTGGGTLLDGSQELESDTEYENKKHGLKFTILSTSDLRFRLPQTIELELEQ